MKARLAVLVLVSAFHCNPGASENAQASSCHDFVSTFPNITANYSFYEWGSQSYYSFKPSGEFGIECSDLGCNLPAHTGSYSRQADRIDAVSSIKATDPDGCAALCEEDFYGGGARYPNEDPLQACINSCTQSYRRKYGKSQFDLRIEVSLYKDTGNNVRFARAQASDSKPVSGYARYRWVLVAPDSRLRCAKPK